MNRRSARLAAAVVATVALSSLIVGGVSADRGSLSAAREASARFHDVRLAGRAGFGQPPAPAPLHFCISSLNGTGAMGFHYINAGNLDKVLDPAKPEVLVYAPDRNGRLKLAALEYVIFQGDWYADHAQGTMPSLFGEEFMPNDGSRFEIPPFFALHVWLYQSNPSGMFAPFNPNVSCDTAAASAGPGGRGATASLARATATARDQRWACSIKTA